MLYEALTGRRPFEGDVRAGDDAQAARAAAEPRRARAARRRDLARLCMRAARSRARRARPTGARASSPQLGAGAVGADARIARTPAPPAFVGRRRELDELARALARRRAGAASRVLVRRPSGIGKSALVRQFLRAARRRRVRARGPLLRARAGAVQDARRRGRCADRGAVALPPADVEALVPARRRRARPAVPGDAPRPALRRGRGAAPRADADPRELRRRGFARAARRARAARAHAAGRGVRRRRALGRRRQRGVPRRADPPRRARRCWSCSRTAPRTTSASSRSSQRRAGGARAAAELREHRASTRLTTADAHALVAPARRSTRRAADGDRRARPRATRSCSSSWRARPQLARGARDRGARARARRAAAARGAGDARGVEHRGAADARSRSPRAPPASSAVTTRPRSSSAERLATLRQVDGEVILRPRTITCAPPCSRGSTSSRRRSGTRRSRARTRTCRARSSSTAQAVVEHWLAAGHPAQCGAPRGRRRRPRRGRARVPPRRRAVRDRAQRTGPWDAAGQRDLLRKQAHALACAGQLDEAATVLRARRAAARRRRGDRLRAPAHRGAAPPRPARRGAARGRDACSLRSACAARSAASRTRLAAQWMQQKLRGLDFIERDATRGPPPPSCARIDVLYSIVERARVRRSRARPRAAGRADARRARVRRAGARVSRARAGGLLRGRRPAAATASAVAAVGARLAAARRRGSAHPAMLGLADDARSASRRT